MFHCLVIKVCFVCLSDSSFILSHLFLFVKHFFKFFSNISELRFCCRFVGDLDTLSYLLSFVNYEFHFLKFFLIVCFSKTIICDSSVIIPLEVMLVNHKIQIFLIILFVSLNAIIFLVATEGWLRTSHFQCGQCKGRRSQSSEARTPSLALPPRWARNLCYIFDV